MSYYLYSAELPSAILRSESHQARSTFSSNPLQSRPVLSPSSPTRSRASPPGTSGVALECRLKDTTSHNLQLRHSAYAPCTWGQVRLCVRRLVRPHVYPHVAVHPGDQGVSANPEVRVDLYQPLCLRRAADARHCPRGREAAGGLRGRKQRTMSAVKGVETTRSRARLAAGSSQAMVASITE
jgi:hypothetical protein